MKINGQEVDRSTIAEIAGQHGLRHSDECRDTNRGQFSFVCRCSFFEEVADYLPESTEDPSTAKTEAKRLLDEGYEQVSRKYRRLAKSNGSGKFSDDATRIEVSPAVFVAFQKISPESQQRSALHRLLNPPRRRGR